MIKKKIISKCFSKNVNTSKNRNGALDILLMASNLLLVTMKKNNYSLNLFRMDFFGVAIGLWEEASKKPPPP